MRALCVGGQVKGLEHRAARHIGARAIEPLQGGSACQGHCRVQATVHGVIQHCGRPHARLILVGMWAGPKGRDDVGMVDHALRDIGMGIECDGDWNLWPDHSAYTRQQLPFGIAVAFSEHGAVQSQQHAIEARLTLQTFNQQTAEMIEGMVRHHAAGIGEGRDRHIHRPAIAVCALDKGTHFQPCSPVVGNHL